MANFTLSEYGKFVSLQNNSGSADAAAPFGGVYLFASGTAGNAKLYLQNEGSSSAIDIAAGFDIDSYTELDAAPHATQDEFLVSDNGTEKRVSMTNLALGVFAVASDSGDVSYGSDGELTIAAGAVEEGMLNNNVISGQDELAQGALAAADELLISDGGTLKRYGVDSLAKDSGALTSEAALDVAADYILFLDGGASGETKKEQLSDVVGNMAGNGLAASAGVLAVGVDDSSIELNSDALRVKAGGIATAMLADDAVDADKLASNAVVNASVASNAAIEATKLNFNVDFGGNVTFGSQTDDTVSFGGPIQASKGMFTHFLTASNARITNLDAVTINSISQTETTLEVSDKLIVASLSASSANSAGGGLRIGGGADSNGHASLLWDHANSALDFNIGGTTEMRLADGALRPETDSDVDLGTTAARFKDAFVDSITVTGEVDAASLDISGNADIDGTLEADAITVNGVSLQVVVEDHVAAMLDGTETGISVSYDATDNNLDFVIDAAQTAITSILATDLKIGEDDQTKIDFETADEIHFYAANAEQVYVADGVLGPQTDSDVDLGADGVAFKKLYVDDIDLNGQGRIDLDADGDTSIRSAADDQIQFEVGGNDRFTMAATGMAIGAGAGAGGSSLGVDGTGNFDGGIVSGQSGQGDSAGGFRVYGSAANEEMLWSVANNNLSFKKDNGSGGSETIVTIGGDADTDFAIEVANGTDNVNKIKAAALVTYSDESLKSDVTSMANTALDTVMSLNGVEFTWKDSGERDFGFIAQEVQKVVPKAVHTGGDGVQGVDYSRLTSVLVEAVKAQQVQIEELKALLKK